ncbi:MAG: carboxypeptidase-like regulatory domain-containing protein, partial [Bryobacterales bacterium]|nr:carboxypeptidase-like regulatory domain-containing protein [Bryobacterales bacterium]
MPRSCCAIAVLLLAWAPVAAPQTITATLQGTVADPTEAVIPGALVTVVNTATNAQFVTESNAAGRFVAPSLQPGPYRVVVEAEGFKRVERIGLVLAVEQTAQIQVVLEVGAVTEVVEVSAEAPLLESTTSSMGQVIDNQKIINLPLNSRNPYRLALLVPGVSGRISDVFNGGRILVNGGRPGTNIWFAPEVSTTPDPMNGG